MEHGTNPGNRPRKILAIVLGVAVLAVVASLVAVVATPPERAEAAGLEPFGSCAELSEWGEEAIEDSSGGSGSRDGLGFEESVATSVVAMPTTSAEDSTEVGAGQTGADQASTEAAVDATNVVVDGVDELDVIDRLDGDRVLVVAGANLAIVDLGAASVVAKHGIPMGSQVTYDNASGVAWVVGQSDDGTKVSVRRVTVGDDSLEAAGTWETAGWLVDARRVDDELHLVASDSFQGDDGIRPPFPGGPVACDDVLHPQGQSDPSATLLVTLPVVGALEPSDAVEVVGSGELVHVTTDAAYLATPQWGETLTTSIHRFDLSDLTHTGSGSVPGGLLNDFSMSEHDGHLRVAITAGGGIVPGGPMIIDDFGGTIPSMPDDMPGADTPVATEEAAPAGVEEPPVTATTVVETTVPETTIPGTPTTSVPETTVPETTVPETTTTTEAPTTTTTTEPIPTVPTGNTIPGPGPDDPINKVVVLDTDGALDVVGSTPWFGHPGERLEGIRFVGDQAYAVTFLQTDPFYVLDLANPTDPKISGEVELPGFSSYLHPVSDGLVVGFGPDGNGQMAAKLFDVSDPSSPTVVDTVVVGDDSPVAYDHHAFTDLGGGRFAIPVTDYDVIVTDCGPMPTEPMPIEPGIGDSTIAEGDMVMPCDGGEQKSTVLELEVSDGRLREVSRASAVLGGYDIAQRVLPVGDGWALVGSTHIALIEGDGALRTSLDLS